MEPQVIQTIADKLDGARQSKKPIATLTESYEGFTVADAYQVQLTNINRELKRGRSIIGKKIGLTSKGMQQMLGVAEPDYGILLDNMMADTESPVSLKALIQPRIEAEIAFILKKQLKGPGIGISQVLQATDGVMPAFEIIDSRIQNLKIKLPDTVADNASSADDTLLGHQWHDRGVERGHNRGWHLGSIQQRLLVYQQCGHGRDGDLECSQRRKWHRRFFRRDQRHRHVYRHGQRNGHRRGGHHV